MELLTETDRNRNDSCAEWWCFWDLFVKSKTETKPNGSELRAQIIKIMIDLWQRWTIQDARGWFELLNYDMNTMTVIIRSFVYNGFDLPNFCWFFFFILSSFLFFFLFYWKGFTDWERIWRKRKTKQTRNQRNVSTENHKEWEIISKYSAGWRNAVMCREYMYYITLYDYIICVIKVDYS